MNRVQNIGHRLSSPSLARDLGGWTARLTLAASTALGLAGGAWLVDPSLAAESRFLALLAACVLVPALSLADRRAPREAWLALLLVVVAGWSLPAPLRGAVVVALLVIVVFAGLFRVERWSFARLVAAAIGLQVLVRSDLLLQPLASVVFGWLVLPLLAAGAVAALERDGRGRGLLAAAATLALAGGITPLACAALVVAGAARWAARRGRRVLVVVGAGGLVLTLLARGAEWASPAELMLLVVGGILVAGLPLAEVDSGASLGQPTSPRAEWGRWWGALLLVGAAVLTLLAPSRPWSNVVGELSWLLLLLPALGAAAATTKRGVLLRALALGVVALRVLPPAAALPLVMVIAAYAVPARDLTVSLAWSTLLLAGTTLLGAYPWLRQEPLEAFIGAFRLAPGWGLALVAAVLATLSSRAPRSRPAVAWGIAALVVLRLWLAGPYDTLHRWPPVELTSSAPEWRLDRIQGTVAELVVDTALANSASLPAGVTVGEIRLESGPETSDAQTAARWPLRVGEETGEWAAARADLRHLESPPPWLQTVAPSGEFFARRYRARFTPEEPVAAERLVIRLAADLPPEVVLFVIDIARRTGGGAGERASSLAQGAESAP